MEDLGNGKLFGMMKVGLYFNSKYYRIDSCGEGLYVLRKYKAKSSIQVSVWSDE